MQYTNRNTVSTIRSTAKIVFAALFMLIIAGTLGDFPLLNSLYVWLAAAAACVSALVLIGGFDEIAISMGDNYVEITSRPLVSFSRKVIKMSVSSPRITDAKFYNILSLRYAAITYLSHKDNKPKTIFVGITCVNSQVRKHLKHDLQVLCQHNKKHNTNL